MANSVKKTLIEINTLSRQLLSRINNIQSEAEGFSEEEKDSDKDDKVANNLESLMTLRQEQIKQLFESNKLDKIKAEQALLDELIYLDKELINQSQTCKNTLAQQVIKLKKSHKVTNSYKKY